MGITKSFERKFLLGWGRHLWNIVGASGFVAVITGIILFGYSLTTQAPKSKSDFFGADEYVLDEMINELKGVNKEMLDALMKKIEVQTEEYEDYVKETEIANNIKLGQRVISPFIAGYGLAVIASASVSSALLSIERNTRKD